MKYIIFCITILLIPVSPAIGQDGSISHLTIHAASLEGNLIEDSPDLSVGVYLPPGYDIRAPKRYPVIYWLHGFSGKGKSTAKAGWKGGPVKAINQLISSGSLKPVIIVMPDGTNRFGGSMYTNSLATGNWEDFIAYELPEFIDAHYRTIPKSESRGIAGHSMGGYGAIKIAMKHPDIFSAVYGTSPCCLARSSTDMSQNIIDEAISIDSWEALAKGSFWSKIILAQSAAYAPNPDNPPFYGDLPYALAGDSTSISENAKAKWLANLPARMADQYISNLQQLQAIAFDAGTRDVPEILANSEYFSNTLTRIEVSNSYEVFEGGHNDKVGERIRTKILPFFSEVLKSEE
ncbi:MAG: alpha/beta hydrolase-fold protein [Pseudomonadales bacterium]